MDKKTTEPGFIYTINILLFYFKYQLKNYKRCIKDMIKESRTTDSVCLKCPDNQYFVFYKKTRFLVRWICKKIKSVLPGVAVDTKNIYNERSLGLLEIKVHTWTAQYKSDWMIAVGYFSQPE